MSSFDVLNGFRIFVCQKRIRGRVTFSHVSLIYLITIFSKNRKTLDSRNTIDTDTNIIIIIA